MAQKDLTSKVLESEPDVFADIFNTLLFSLENEKIVNSEDNLIDEPTEGIYRDYSGNLRNMFKDISKEYHRDDAQSYLACFNIENEATVKRTIPLKCLGYKYATLKRQQDLYENKRKALNELKNKAKEEGNTEKYELFDNELKNIGKFHTVPFISIVLNFDDKAWDEPTNLADLNIESIYNKYDEPFRIKVFNVKSFDKELRSKFTSDFRIFVEMFCTNDLPDELKDVSLKHPTELIDMVVAFTKNKKLEDIRNRIAVDELEGKTMSMGTIFDNVAYKEVIAAAITNKTLGMDDQKIIQFLMIRLETTWEKATEIFEKEVLIPASA
ncbi:MAG: hypothetical protein MJ110_06070 [Lachnospiraceae bacterium]|nr:hypothetical protein [Lachnospiraceae bacterium]